MHRPLIALLLAACCLLAPATACAKWLRAESPRFVVYGEGDAKALRAYAEKLETFDSVLRQMHGMDPLGAPPRKLDIYLVPGNLAIKQVSPDLDDDVSGFYHAGPGDIFAIAARNGDPDNTILHEYVHHFMLQYFPSSYPAWLIEGYAEYFSNTTIRDDEISVGMANNRRAWSLLEGDWIPIADLLGKRVSDLKRDEPYAFYAQAWALTHYLVSDPARYKQMQGYMAAVAAGADPVRAMQEATGLPPAELGKTVRAYIRGNLAYKAFRNRGLPKPEITVTPLPKAADDLLLPLLRMRSGMTYDDGGELMRKVVRPRAARYPDDRLASLTLAYGEIWFGDRAAGDALLQRMVVADPKDAEAMQLLGISRVIEAGRVKSADEDAMLLREAGRFLLRSHQIGGPDYKTLYFYTLTRKAEPGYPSENTLNTATMMFNLAPQVGAIRMHYARMLVAGKEWDNARSVLRPLANDPHGGGAAAEARKLMATVEAELAKVGKPATP